MARTVLFLLLMLPAVWGCGLPGSEGIVTPPPGLTDEVVVPAELEADYQHWVDYYASPDKPRIEFEALTLSSRRAYTYFMFVDADVTRGEVLVATTAAEKGTWDAIIDEAASRLGVQNMDWDHYSQGSEWYDLSSGEPKTLGELAWIADWLVSNYPDVIQVVTGNGLFRLAGNSN